MLVLLAPPPTACPSQTMELYCPPPRRRAVEEEEAREGGGRAEKLAFKGPLSVSPRPRGSTACREACESLELVHKARTWESWGL